MPMSSHARAIAKYLHLGPEQGFGIISILGMDTLRVRAMHSQSYTPFGGRCRGFSIGL